MFGLNWLWIGVMLVLPPLAAVLVAYPLWRAGSPIFGNIVGTMLIFGTALGLMFREYAELDRLMQNCLARNGEFCFPEPSGFARYAIYASIGLLEVFALFLFSLRIEHRVRTKDVAPEWR